MKTIINISSVSTGEPIEVTYSNPVTTVVNQPDPPPVITRYFRPEPCDKCECNCNCGIFCRIFSLCSFTLCNRTQCNNTHYNSMQCDRHEIQQDCDCAFKRMNN